AANRLRHASTSAPARASDSCTCAAASGGTKNVGSAGQPRFRFVRNVSSAPSGEPCASNVPLLLGAPYPITASTAISEGRFVAAVAARGAGSIARRSLPSATRSTCQPYAAKRAVTSSVKVIDVVPDSVTWLLS